MTDREMITTLAMAGTHGSVEIDDDHLTVPMWSKRYTFDAEGNITAVQKIRICKNRKRAFEPFRIKR